MSEGAGAWLVPAGFIPAGSTGEPRGNLRA
jgi:hypothetical protein